MITRKSKHEWRVEVPLTREITKSNQEWEDMIDWCHKTFGPGGRNKKYRWRFGWTRRARDIDRLYVDTFYFRNEKDAMFFVLRWS